LFETFFQALLHLHQGKIIHRDVKASNIVINKDGEVKLVDYGLSRYIIADDKNDFQQSLTTLFLFIFLGKLKMSLEDAIRVLAPRRGWHRKLSLAQLSIKAIPRDITIKWTYGL